MQIDDPMSTPLERDVAEKALRLKMARDKFTGSDEEYADWGMRRMGQFLYNLPRMAVDAKVIRETEDQNEKEAFLYLMEAYDRTDPTLEGFARWAAGAMVDPTTYVGIGSLGAGMIARSTGQQMTKEGLKSSPQGGCACWYDCCH